MPIFQFLPGVGTVKDAARGEMSELSDDRKSFDGKYNWGDQLRGLLGGYSEEDVREKAAEMVRKETTDSKSEDIETIRQLVPGLKDGSLDMKVGETDAKYGARLAGKKLEASAIQELLSNPKADISMVKDGMSAAAIQQLSRNLKDEATQKAEIKSDTRYYDMLEREAQRRQDDREDRRAERADNREIRLLELNQSNNRRKSELFQALFGLGSAFMI